MKIEVLILLIGILGVIIGMISKQMGKLILWGCLVVILLNYLKSIGVI